MVWLRGEGSLPGEGFKRKFEEREKTPIALDIEAKLKAAETRREMLRLRGSNKRPGGAQARANLGDNASRRLRLEEKLASAEAKRKELLQSVVARAAERYNTVQARAAALKQRQSQLAHQLEAHLLQAEAARGARLAEMAARAGQQYARVREAAAEQKLRAAVEAARRKLDLLQRQEQAERRRQEALQAMLAAVQAKHSGEGFLPREAARREQLRRRTSSRKLQAAWRTFCEQRQTTRALAQAFVDTGVPFMVELGPQEQGLGPQHESPVPPAFSSRMAASQMPHGLSAEPTPAGTPDPCGSPTSTVRRHDGRLASAPVSIPQTPHTTPNRTPTPSVAGSPTNGLARRVAGGAAAEAGSATTAAAGRERRGTGSAAPATPVYTPPAMPPLRSIASPAPPAAAQESSEPGAGTFERLAAALSAPATLTAAQVLLQRLESRVNVKGVSAGCCAGLLRRLFPRVPPGRAPERYPPRIFLCAYMVLAHPDVVFSVRGDREAALTAAGRDMLTAFEALLARLAAVPSACATAGSGSSVPGGALTIEEGEALRSEGSAIASPLASMLQRFDECWVAYLEQFVAWKSADAAGLETELIRVAVELERSRLSKLAAPTVTPRARRLRSPEDLQAIATAVDHDLSLIGERVRRLTGAQGTARLEAALAAARAAAAAEFAMQHREAANSSDMEPSSPATAIGLSRSPSQSPLKKAQRSSGEYEGATSSASGSSSASAEVPPAPSSMAATSEAQGPLSRTSSSMSLGSIESSSGALAAAALSAAVDMDVALSQQPNLALMWHLLYDSQWQLPTADLEAAWGDALGHTNPMRKAPPSAEELAAAGDPRQAAALMQRQVKRIAEQAFWDSVLEKLCSGGGSSTGKVAGSTGQAASAADQAAGLLAELGSQLGEVLPAGVVQEVAARLDSQLLLQELLPPAGSGSGLNLQALLGLLDWAAGLVAQYGAPARDAAAAAGHAAVRRQLAAAAGDAAATAAAAVRALRLLTVQLKMLRVDAANAHLRLLMAQLHSEGAAAWAASKFEAMLGSAGGFSGAEELGAWLPHTRAWLAGASGQLPQVEQLAALHAGSAGSGGTAVEARQEQRQALPQLRAGLRGSSSGNDTPSSSSSGSAAGQQQQGQQWVSLQVPVEPRSWQGLVRLGLVQLVSGEGTIGRLPLPETLRLDAARLHTAQGEFQRLLVLTISLLLVRQGATASGRPLSAAELATAKRRLAILLANPGMCLPDLAAEVARLAGGEASAARERAVQDSIHRMISRSSGAMRALVSGFTTALLALLVLGLDSSEAQDQAALALRRCGAGDLALETAELARQLVAVAAVTEAVCAQYYQRLSGDLL